MSIEALTHMINTSSIEFGLNNSTMDTKNPDEVVAFKESELFQLPTRSEGTGLVEDPYFQSPRYNPKEVDSYRTEVLEDDGLVHVFQFKGDELMTRTTWKQMSPQEMLAAGLDIKKHNFGNSPSEYEDGLLVKRYVECAGTRIIFDINKITGEQVDKHIVKFATVAGGSGEDFPVKVKENLSGDDLWKDLQQRLSESSETTLITNYDELRHGRIDRYVNNLDTSAHAPTIDSDLKRRMRLEYGAWSILYRGDWCIKDKKWKELAEVWEDFSKEIEDYIYTHTFGIPEKDTNGNRILPEDRFLFQTISAWTEESDHIGPGAYYREQPLLSASGRKLMDAQGQLAYPPGSIHERIRLKIKASQYRESWKRARDWVEIFDHIYLVSTSATGPLDPQTGCLLYETIYNHIDRTRSRDEPTTGFFRYNGNLRFLSLLWDIEFAQEKLERSLPLSQRDQRKGYDFAPLKDRGSINYTQNLTKRSGVYKVKSKDETTGEAFESKDPSINGLRILFLTEFLKKTGRTRRLDGTEIPGIGMAMGIRYTACALGLVDRIHQAGFRSKKEYFESGLGDKTMKFRGDVDPEDLGNLLKAQGEALPKFIAFIDHPVPNEKKFPETEWDSLLSSILPLIDNYYAALAKVDRGYAHYFVFRILSAALNHAVDDSLEENMTQFKEDKVPGRGLRYLIINHPYIVGDKQVGKPGYLPDKQWRIETQKATNCSLTDLLNLQGELARQKSRSDSVKYGIQLISRILAEEVGEKH